MALLVIIMDIFYNWLMEKDFQIQEQYSSIYDKSKLCSYDVEFIDSPTKPLIHQSSRFWLFLGGDATITIDQKEYHVTKNTFVLITPWATSKINTVKQPLYMIKIVFSSQLIENMRTSFNVTNEYLNIMGPIEENPVVQLEEREATKIKQIMYAIRDEVGTESLFDKVEEKAFSNIYIANKISELMIEFYRNISKINFKDDQGQSVDFKDRTEIIKYIYSHVTDNISLSKLSKVFAMSESSICNYIHDLTGMSFRSLVKEMRISKAVDLLTFTDSSISDVADFVGFADTSHMDKVFMENLNMLPNKYREDYQINNNIFKEKDKPIAFEIINYISLNYTSDLKVEDVANKFKISVVDLNRCLVYLVERNFDSLLHNYRINKACELLLKDDAPLVDIAFEVGYNSTKTFNRNFVRLKHMTPGEFRKKITLQKGSESIKEEENDQ